MRSAFSAAALRSASTRAYKRLQHTTHTHTQARRPTPARTNAHVGNKRGQPQDRRGEDVVAVAHSSRTATDPFRGKLCLLRSEELLAFLREVLQSCEVAVIEVGTWTPHPGNHTRPQTQDIRMLQATLNARAWAPRTVRVLKLQAELHAQLNVQLACFCRGLLQSGDPTCTLVFRAASLAARSLELGGSAGRFVRNRFVRPLVVEPLADNVDTAAVRLVAALFGFFKACQEVSHGTGCLGACQRVLPLLLPRRDTQRQLCLPAGRHSKRVQKATQGRSHDTHTHV